MSQSLEDHAFDVFSSAVEIEYTGGAGPAPIRFTLTGAAAVEREPVRVSGNTFEIPVKLVAMDHSGEVAELGGPVTLVLAPGAFAAGRVRGTWDPERKAPVWPATGEFEAVRVQLDTAAGVFDMGPANVRGELSSIPPYGAVYGHPNPVPVTKAGAPAGSAKARHIVFHPREHARPERREQTPCAPPACKVEAHGHCSCFEVRDERGRHEQLLFVASHPGVAASPVGRDRILAYETITNQGPRAVRVYWDGDPDTNPDKDYKNPQQSALLLPGNSLTVAAGRAVKVAYSAEPAGLAGNFARGHDVISWCCPEWTGKG